MSKKILSFIFCALVLSSSYLSALSYEVYEIGGEGYEETTYFLNDQGKVVHRDEDSGEFKLFEVRKGWKHLSKIPSQGDDGSPDYPIRDFTKSGIILGNNDDDHPFVYYPDKTYVDLPKEISKVGQTVESFNEKSLHINEKGMVVGLLEYYDEQPNTVFTYTRKNGIQFLDLPDHEEGPVSVSAINNCGQILLRNDGNDYFFLYDPVQGLTHLGSFDLKEILADKLGVTHNSGEPLTLIMNDNGVIAGWVGADYDDEDDMTIFVYNPDTGTDIVPIKRDSYRDFPPFILTNDNQVIVSSGRQWHGGGDAEDVQKAFIWSEDEGLRELVNWKESASFGVDGSSPTIQSLKMSEDGRIQFVGVNSYEDESENDIYEGFVWDSVEGYQKLNDVIGNANNVFNMDGLGDSKISINNRGDILIDNVPTFKEDGDGEENTILLVPVDEE